MYMWYMNLQRPFFLFDRCKVVSFYFVCLVGFNTISTFKKNIGVCVYLVLDTFGIHACIFVFMMWVATKEKGGEEDGTKKKGVHARCPRHRDAS